MGPAGADKSDAARGKGYGAGQAPPPSRGFVVTEGRTAKAAKISRIIREAAGADVIGRRLLDVGIGTGEIVSIFGQEFDAVGVDVVDQRAAKQGYAFALCNEALPFSGESFDVVVSNHVIEHVANQALHIAELARVVKRGGVVYLATPNRLWPWEVHYQVPFLHYLPKPLFHRALSLLGRFREELDLLGWWRLRADLSPYFDLRVFSDKIIRDPRRYFLACPDWAARVLRWLPERLLRWLVFLHPTFVLVLIRR
jgi:SAM-dependent methyltransferase